MDSTRKPFRPSLPLAATLLAAGLFTAGCAVAPDGDADGGTASETPAAEASGPQADSSSAAPSSSDAAEDAAAETPEDPSDDASTNSEGSEGSGSAPAEESPTPSEAPDPAEPGLPAPEDLDADGQERSEELGAFFSRDEACMTIGSTVDGLRADMDGGLQTEEDLAGAHEAVEQTYRLAPSSLRAPLQAVDQALGEDLEALDREGVLEELEPVDAWMQETCDGEYHSQDGGQQEPSDSA